ncbi:MAG: choice-of-anchor Q domain-containing protein, partial [Solirubrobacterales bacterium]
TDGIGGGVFGPGTLRNSILANNTVPVDNNAAPTSNCAGATDGGHNLAFPAGGSAGCPPSLNGNPLLGGLAANGGPTLTMALPAASPARDQIPLSGSGCPATDQRGFFRAPVAPCDIGAFERGAPASLPSTPPSTPGTAVGAVAAAPAATPAAGKKKCKKGRKLKRGKCVKKK